MIIKTIKTFFLLSLLAMVLFGCKGTRTQRDWRELRKKNNYKDTNCLYSRTCLPERPLTLDDIITISLRRNLNLMVKQQEYLIQREVATREHYNLLPKLITNWENWGRTTNTGAFSQSLVPGVPPAPLSISSDQNIKRYDVTFVFNLVDFGIAYFRSRQECNKVLIAQLEYERLRQTLVVDITRQFWKGAVAKIALIKGLNVIDKALEQQSALHRQMEARLVSDIQGLRNENQLINIRGQLQSYSAQYHSAKSELALHMGIPASFEFELADIVVMGVDVDLCDVCDLEKYALLNRPDLISTDVEEVVHLEEARAAVVQMFPGIELYGGPYHDSNSFLLFNNWLAAGLRATWNLLDIPSRYQEKIIATNRKKLTRINRLALSIGVMAQVHLSYHLFLDNLESYMIAKELATVNKRLLLAAKSEQREGKLNQADILKYESEALFSEIDAGTKYAEVQNSLEQLNSAIGMPRYFRTNTVYGEEFTYEESTSNESIKNPFHDLNEEDQEQIDDEQDLEEIDDLQDLQEIDDLQDSLDEQQDGDTL